MRRSVRPTNSKQIESGCVGTGSAQPSPERNSTQEVLKRQEIARARFRAPAGHNFNGRDASSNPRAAHDTSIPNSTQSASTPPVLDPPLLTQPHHHPARRSRGIDILASGSNPGGRSRCCELAKLKAIEKTSMQGVHVTRYGLADSFARIHASTSFTRCGCATRFCREEEGARGQHRRGRGRAGKSDSVSCKTGAFTSETLKLQSRDWRLRRASQRQRAVHRAI